MLILLFRGIFLVGILSWYSTNVWKMIDGYFKERFEKYLQSEYEKNPKMRDDVDAYGTSVRNDKGRAAARDAAASTREDTDRDRGTERSCDTVSARGEETCPIDYAAVEALAGDKTGSGSLSESGSAADMIGSVLASESEVSGKGAMDKNTFAESPSSPSTKNTNELPVEREGNFDADRSAKSVSNAVATVGEVDENATATADTSRGATTERRADGSPIGDALENSAMKPTKRKSTQRRLSRKSVKSRTADGEAARSQKKRRKQKVKTIILTEEDFKQAKIRSGLRDYDFSEFDDDDEEDSHETAEGVLVSQLPFKPRADIGHLDRVTDDEFCPLTLEDEGNCGETKTWP